MSVLLVLIAISLMLALVFLICFIQAVRSGQMDDQETPAIRILFDEKTTPQPLKKE